MLQLMNSPEGHTAGEVLGHLVLERLKPHRIAPVLTADDSVIAISDTKNKPAFRSPGKAGLVRQRREVLADLLAVIAGLGFLALDSFGFGG